ncbi:hypothetical protein PybrP1_008382 [[Pythium] brassicae (nom. inval.)]|nr:hypothetical protein PybrP1_008382 [[Pythium] brassicae (nom. inval.)]
MDAPPAASTPAARPLLQNSRSSGSLSECDDGSTAPAPNQVVARSAQGGVFYLFNHQAGGHKPFLRTANGHVCKPVIPLELQFYQALDERYAQLKPFVPPFIGVVSVELSLPSSSGGGGGATSSDSDAAAPMAASSSVGDLTQLVADRKSPAKSSFTTKVSLPSSAHGKKRRLGKHPSGGGGGDAAPASYSAKLWRKERTKRKAGVTRSNSTGPLKDILSTAALSPSLWLAVCGCCMAVACSRSLTSSRRTAHYLVLDDLTLQYSRPCVLDIKMGTRQHGEDATPAKALSHTAKCEATTSASLGLRLCGMQVYNEAKEKYTLWDKHWGRKLAAADIQPALETYLSNGSALRYDVLAPILTKVQALKRVLEQTRGLRFWGASLLVIYEGDTRQSAPREGVYLIDFAHCQMSPALDSPDDGLVLGLANIDRFLSAILASGSAATHELQQQD